VLEFLVMADRVTRSESPSSPSRVLHGPPALFAGRRDVVNSRRSESCRRPRSWALDRNPIDERYGAEVLRVPSMHKDGRRLSIAFTVTLLFSPSGDVRAIAAIVRDETTRRNEERALRGRVAELKARRRSIFEAGLGSLVGARSLI